MELRCKAGGHPIIRCRGDVLQRKPGPASPLLCPTGPATILAPNPVRWHRRLLARAAAGGPMPRLRATTILALRHKGQGAIGGDGQVTLGNVVMKSDAHKIRKLYDGKVTVGFAGASADAFALLERFEAKLRDHQGS